MVWLDGVADLVPPVIVLAVWGWLLLVRLAVRQVLRRPGTANQGPVPPWRLALAAAVPLPLSMAAGVAATLLVADPVHGQIAARASSLLAVLVVLRLLRSGEALPAEGGLRRDGVAGAVLRGLLLWVAALPVVLLAGQVAEAVLRPEDGGDPQQGMKSLILAAGPGARVGLFLAFVLLTPLTEEIIFRGLLQRALRVRVGPGTAILGTALVFTAVHPPGTWPAVAILAVVLSVVMDRTGRLVAPIAVHMVQNLLAFLHVLSEGRR